MSPTKTGSCAGHLFEEALSIRAEDVELELRGFAAVPWAEHLLNPRRLRGSDFLMRWSQGVWSEHRLLEAINNTRKYHAIEYGPSGVAPTDVREYELYFERLEQAGLGKVKRPDLLLFAAADRAAVERAVANLGGAKELPFTPEDDPRMKDLFDQAVVAIECENSLWKASKMPAFGQALTPQKRLGGKLGLKKTAVVPTVILKDEDFGPLREWTTARDVPIHIWHVFYDLAFGIPLDRAEQLIRNGDIQGTKQVFQAPGGATTTKVIFKIYYQHAYPLGRSSKDPDLNAASIMDANGHILPYVTFSGGALDILPEAVAELDRVAAVRRDRR